MSGFITICLTIASLIITLYSGKASAALSNREVVELLISSIMFLLIMCVFRSILLGKVMTDNPFFDMKGAIMTQGLMYCLLFIWVYFFTKIVTNYTAGNDI
tara:strand:+ start:156 stop:458 length:303 start_codon:yes stop_codon:yes gene_type:complete